MRAANIRRNGIVHKRRVPVLLRVGKPPRPDTYVGTSNEAYIANETTPKNESIATYRLMLLHAHDTGDMRLEALALAGMRMFLAKNKGLDKT